MKTLLQAFQSMSEISQAALLSDLVFNYSVSGSWHENAKDYDGDINAAAKDILGGEFGEAAAIDIQNRL